MLKCTVQVMRWRNTRAQPSVQEFDVHTMSINEQPLQAEALTILVQSLSHTYAHSAIMTLQIYMVPTALCGIRANERYTFCNVESKVFTPYNFGSTAGNQTPNHYPGLCV